MHGIDDKVQQQSATAIYTPKRSPTAKAKSTDNRRWKLNETCLRCRSLCWCIASMISDLPNFSLDGVSLPLADARAKPDSSAEFGYNRPYGSIQD